MGNIYYSQQKLDDISIIQRGEKDEILNHVRKCNINKLAQFINENVKEEKIYNPEFDETTCKHSVAILPVDEYKELKAIEKEYKRLLGGNLND